MKLEKVLEKVEYSIINGNTNTEITDICYDSRKIKEGCLFICLVGSSFDGHDYIDKALENMRARRDLREQEAVFRAGVLLGGGLVKEILSK